MIPPIATFKLVHESYTLDGDLSNTGVMIDVSWKEHYFRVPMCWMMRLETNTAKRFIRFAEDINTTEEMLEIISKLRVQYDAKVKFYSSFQGYKSIRFSILILILLFSRIQY